MPPSLLIPDADVRLLRCDSASGYTNVYPHHNRDAFGRQMYVARVKRDGRLVTLPRSRSPLPHVSARAVVAWYSGRYGPSWRDVFTNRKNRARPKLPPWRAWHSARWGGWLLEVWIDGRPEVVPLMVRRGRRRGRERSWVPHAERPRVFASEAEAVAFAHRAPLYRYGVLGMAMRVARQACWGGLCGPRPLFPGAKPPPVKRVGGGSILEPPPTILASPRPAEPGPARPRPAATCHAPPGLDAKSIPARRRKNKPDPDGRPPPPPFAPALSRAA